MKGLPQWMSPLGAGAGRTSTKGHREMTLMKKPARFLALSAVVTGALLAAPVGASATTFTAPTELNFPDRSVGTQSDPQVVQLFVQCSNYIGFPVDSCVTASFDSLSVSPTVTGDFVVTQNNCPATFSPPSGSSAAISCTILVGFKPKASGTRNGTLNTGTTALALPAPTVALKGVGIPGPSTAKKKCKKKKSRSAVAAKKKCKKK